MPLWILFGGIFDPENSVIKLKELNKLVEAPNLWDDQISAQQLMKDRTYLEDRLTNYQELEFDIKDNISILELADAENDNDLLEEGKNKGSNLDSYSRYIYIHGTNEEGMLGEKSSHGCIRMSNSDIIDLCDKNICNSFVYICEK